MTHDGFLVCARKARTLLLIVHILSREACKTKPNCNENPRSQDVTRAVSIFAPAATTVVGSAQRVRQSACEQRTRNVIDVGWCPPPCSLLNVAPLEGYTHAPFQGHTRTMHNGIICALPNHPRNLFITQQLTCDDAFWWRIYIYIVTCILVGSQVLVLRVGMETNKLPLRDLKTFL